MVGSFSYFFLGGGVGGVLFFCFVLVCAKWNALLELAESTAESERINSGLL